MKALQFHMNVPKIVLTRTLGLFSKQAYTAGFAPVVLDEIPDARVRGDVRGRAQCASELLEEPQVPRQEVAHVVDLRAGNHVRAHVGDGDPRLR